MFAATAGWPRRSFSAITLMISRKACVAQLADMHALAARQPMLRADDQHQFIAHNRRRLQVAGIGQERQDGEIEIALANLLRQLRRQLAKDFDLDLRIAGAEIEDELWQQIKAGAFVSANADAPAFQIVKLL